MIDPLAGWCPWCANTRTIIPLSGLEPAVPCPACPPLIHYPIHNVPRLIHRQREG